MTIDEVRTFLEEQHRGVVTTFRKNGATQVSILATGYYRGGMAFVIRGDTAKLANLRRDPRCAVLTVTPDWREYAVVEGTSSIRSWDDTDPEELRLLLREVFSACGGGEHPDWEEYDLAMKQERRAVVMVSADHVYGLLR